MSTELAKPEKKQLTLKDHLSSDAFKAQVAMALPQHLTADRFIRVALTALNRTPKLATCTQESFFQCALDLSAMGLEPDGRRAHLIPYGDKCTLVVDYKGLVELALRSGDVSSIHADKVCENDEFEYDRGVIGRHKIDFRKPRGEAYAYYVIIKKKDGTEKAEVMTKEEVDAIRKRSKSANSGPWVTDYDEMGKKTVFKRASKWITLSPEIRDRLDKEDEVDFGGMKRATGTVVGTPLFSAPALEAPKRKPEAEANQPEHATKVAGLRNLMQASGVTEGQVLAYIAKETGDTYASVEEAGEQLAKSLIRAWPGIIDEVKGGK